MDAPEMSLSRANDRKQRGATRAQLEHRAKMLHRSVAQQVAEYWKQQRDARVARRIAKMLKAVQP